MAAPSRYAVAMDEDRREELSEEENDQLWAQEAERRYAEYQAGNMEAVSADELFARLRSRRQ